VPESLLLRTLKPREMRSEKNLKCSKTSNTTAEGGLKKQAKENPEG
jgi:hypothetical protein